MRIDLTNQSKGTNIVTCLSVNSYHNIKLLPSHLIHWIISVEHFLFKGARLIRTLSRLHTNLDRLWHQPSRKKMEFKWRKFNLTHACISYALAACLAPPQFLLHLIFLYSHALYKVDWVNYEYGITWMEMRKN